MLRMKKGLALWLVAVFAAALLPVASMTALGESGPQTGISMGGALAQQVGEGRLRGRYVNVKDSNDVYEFIDDTRVTIHVYGMKFDAHYTLSGNVLHIYGEILGTSSELYCVVDDDDLGFTDGKYVYQSTGSSAKDDAKNDAAGSAKDDAKESAQSQGRLRGRYANITGDNGVYDYNYVDAFIFLDDTRVDIDFSGMVVNADYTLGGNRLHIYDEGMYGTQTDFYCTVDADDLGFTDGKYVYQSTESSAKADAKAAAASDAGDAEDAADIKADAKEAAASAETLFTDEAKALYCQAIFDAAMDYGGISQVQLADLNLDGLPELVIQWESDEWQVPAGYLVYTLVDSSVKLIATSWTKPLFGGYALPFASAYPLFRLVEDNATGERSYLLFISRHEGVSHDDQMIHIEPGRKFDASIDSYNPAILSQEGTAFAHYHGHDGDGIRDDFNYEKGSPGIGQYTYNGYKTRGMNVDGEHYTKGLDVFFFQYSFPPEPDNSMMPRFGAPYINRYDPETGLTISSGLFTQDAAMAFLDSYMPEASTGTSHGGAAASAISESSSTESTGTSHGGAAASAVSAPSPWAEADIVRLRELDLLPAALDGSYQQNITRAEFTLLAAGLYEKIKGSASYTPNVFSDTQALDADMQEAIDKLGALGIVIGVGENRFNPDAEITRQEVAAILGRLMEALGRPLPPSASTLADIDMAADWAREYISLVHGAGLMDGTDNNRFSPLANFTREESLVTLMRVWNDVPTGINGRGFSGISGKR